MVKNLVTSEAQSYSQQKKPAHQFLLAIIGEKNVALMACRIVNNFFQLRRRFGNFSGESRAIPPGYSVESETARGEAD
jgi:hypothetical protein